MKGCVASLFLFFFIANLLCFQETQYAILKLHKKVLLALISVATAAEYISRRSSTDLDVEFNGCRLQQVPLEYHHPDHLLAHYKCGLQYHQL